MNTLGSEQLELAAQQFIERYGVTPHFFTRKCLLPSLLAVTILSCFYGDILVEVLERPAWKTRLRALRTLLAVAGPYMNEGGPAKSSKGGLGPRQLALIASSFLEADSDSISPKSWIPKCLKPCLEATGRAFLFYRGRLTDSVELQLPDVHLEALIIVGKLRKLFPDDRDNSFSATHRDIVALVSVARQNGKSDIQLGRRSQVVYMR